MDREPYTYENNPDLDPKTNAELRIVHNHLNSLRRLYNEVAAELESVKEEKAKLEREQEKRFNAIETEQKIQRTMLEGMEKVLGKIESTTDGSRKLLIQLLVGGVITAVVTFGMKFVTP